MSIQPPTEEDAQSKAGASPLIEAFGIRGLYGYRNISLATHNAATILIARNGSGKTTLLSVLNAFLKLEFSRLRNLEFNEIFCRFRGGDDLILTYPDLQDALSISTDIAKIARRMNLDPDTLFSFVAEESLTLTNRFDSPYDHPIFAKFAEMYGYDTQKIKKVISDLNQSTFDRNENTSYITNSIKSHLSGHEVLYLPTYRRVELALREDAKASPPKRKRSRIAFDSGRLFTGDIQFGLGDISDRLHEMNEQIEFQSSSEYRKISANIITDLIDGSFENSEFSGGKAPSKDDLDLLFSRVQQNRRRGPSFYSVVVPNLDRLYSPHGVPAASKPFLDYFLRQLDQVIETTRGVELRVQQFVDVCNRYLASDDVETYLHIEQFEEGDAKQLVLDKANLKVTVRSRLFGKIDLEELSSGEKQMISLFAKLYLYESPKILLIDEPELSLSIGWQRRILVDVINSPLCRQMIAITHSPFVFDNELEPFAGSLNLSTDRRAIRAVSDSERSEDDSFDQ